MCKYKPRPLILNNEPLQYVDSYKYLGVTLDNHLTYNTHLNNTIKITAYKLHQLGMIRRYITEGAALQIYKTMVLPYLDYGDIFIIGANKSKLAKMQRLQNRGLKMCQDIISAHGYKDPLNICIKDLRIESHMSGPVLCDLSQPPKNPKQVGLRAVLVNLVFMKDFFQRQCPLIYITLIVGGGGFGGGGGTTPCLKFVNRTVKSPHPHPLTLYVLRYNGAMRTRAHLRWQIGHISTTLLYAH